MGPLETPGNNVSCLILFICGRESDFGVFLIFTKLWTPNFSVLLQEQLSSCSLPNYSCLSSAPAMAQVEVVFSGMHQHPGNLEFSGVLVLNTDMEVMQKTNVT